MDLNAARSRAIQYNLDGPKWALDYTTPISMIRNRIGSSGGCGPGKWGDWLVPDTIYLVNIKPACYLHDCEYSEMESEDDRKYADKRLFDNANKIVELKSSNKFTLWLRRARLMKYWAAVDIGGAGIDKKGE